MAPKSRQIALSDNEHVYQVRCGSFRQPQRLPDARIMVAAKPTS